MVATTTKKASTKTAAGASSAKKPTSKGHQATHPSWVDMIKECITAHPEEARGGVSRPTIKKFVESKYKIERNAMTNSQLARAITVGAEKGQFVLPKGPAGKVKLPPKGHKEAAKENAPALKKPISANKPALLEPAPMKTPTRKYGAKAAAAKKPAAAPAKAAPAKKAPAKKAPAKTTTAKKPAAPSRTMKKRGTAKRAATGGKAAPKKTAGRKPRAKAAAAAAPAEKKKPGRKPAAKKVCLNNSFAVPVADDEICDHFRRLIFMICYVAVHTGLALYASEFCSPDPSIDFVLEILSVQCPVRTYNASFLLPPRAYALSLPRHLPPIQRTLLEHIVPTWEPTLAEQNLTPLVEQYFVPDGDHASARTVFVCTAGSAVCSENAIEASSVAEGA
ncbi:hypothetical protein EWM64_g3170 [Hericium alpestre]|uniref:Histone H1 n=1 Tax=Hericium alpestre TaxID=135208 RepID=A0A4Z0A1A0_9AGAM|nr:hypothetical protein EWM64_g3170 [Hericium alpestre]